MLLPGIGAVLKTDATPKPAKDIGAVPDGLDTNLANFLSSLRAAVQELAGNRGDQRNYAVRWSDMQAKGFADVNLLPAITGITGPPGPAGPTGPAGTTTPDLTAPPTPTTLAAVAGLTSIIVSWDVATYTQGHGPKQTNIYVVKKAASDPTLPTFPGASGLTEAAPHALNIIDIAVDTSIRCHVWATFVTNDGVESASPAGGTNGVVVQTGKIGTKDLTDLLITADKLSQGTYPNVNLVPNPGAEDSVSGVPVAWTLVEGIAGTFTADTSDKTGGTASFRITKALATDNVAYGCRAFPVIPGETYSVKLRARGNVASAAGLYLRAQEKTTAPTSGYIDSTTRTSFTDFVNNGPINATWTAYEYTYTVPAGIYWATFSMYCWGTSTNTSLWWDDVQVGRQITASSIAAGSIAVGTAAIQNGAIVNAMIGTAAIDDAKVGNLSAAKLTAGTGVIGGNLQSTNYVANTSGWIVRPNGTAEFDFTMVRGTLQAGQITAGYVTASMINSRGLSIQDAGGNILFSSGSVVGSGNLMVNGDFLQVSAGLPVGFNIYGFSGTAACSAGAPIGVANYVRLTATTATSNPYGPQIATVVSSCATQFGGFKNNTNYVLSWYLRTNSSFASQCSLTYNYPPANLVYLQNPVPNGNWQRYVALINYGSNTLDNNVFFGLGVGGQSAPAGSYADIACVQIEQGDTPSGWSPPPITSQNQITPANVSTYIANVAIQTAQIANLAVGTAQIANLAVDTLQIKGNAVTVPGASTVSALITLTTTNQTIMSVPIDPGSAPVYVTVTIVLSAGTAVSGMHVMFALTATVPSGGGVAAYSSGATLLTGSMALYEERTVSFSYYDNRGGSGPRTYGLDAYYSGGSGTLQIAAGSTLFAIGTKK